MCYGSASTSGRRGFSEDSMVHFADASPNGAAIRTGGAKGLGWPSPNVSRTTAATSSSETSTLQGFDEAQAGFATAMKQLVDVADMMRSRKRFAIPSRGCGRSIFGSITLATDRSGSGPAR